MNRSHSPGTKIWVVSKNTPQALKSRVIAIPLFSSTGSATRKRCARRLSGRLGVQCIYLAIYSQYF